MSYTIQKFWPMLQTNRQIGQKLSMQGGVLHGSVVKCLTRNPGVLGSRHTGSSGFFRGSVLGQDTPEPQPSTGENQERHE